MPVIAICTRVLILYCFVYRYDDDAVLILLYYHSIYCYSSCGLRFCCCNYYHHYLSFIVIIVVVIVVIIDDYYFCYGVFLFLFIMIINNIAITFAITIFAGVCTDHYDYFRSYHCPLQSQF